MKPVIKFECVSEDVKAKPMYACGHCRMLGVVIDANNDLQAAERCCLCENCGERPREKYRTLCVECDHALRALAAIELRERLNALPEEDYTGGPVCWGDEFYNDLESALDEIDESELPLAIVHPCDVVPAALPDVASYIEEYIAEQFDFGPHDFCLSDDDEVALSNTMRRISPPNVWLARGNVRLTRSWLNPVTEETIS